jgi:nanoRNase/pAp phosphatase (c-di-AMP/oligoRNAs hydrolase)
MNDQQKLQVLEQVKSASHVLVTVSTNPTVDELAASIGLTLALNKMDKHATTVFSGVVPSTIEFLQPEKTIETTTDSLRDFIIALDKSKADKLRYKVEDDVVRIFITPYKTSISDKDLEFSQGDFNVDAVIALGVTKRQDLDTVIVEHGKILHDATIIALTKRDAVSDLGAINWQDTQASSLCEMVATILTEIQPDILDGQMATAFLTGIIAETDRFKNDRTTPLALSLSSRLMSAGANQQLIAEKLEAPEAAPGVLSEYSLADKSEAQGSDGQLEISHDSDEVDKIHIDDDGNLNLQELSQELPPVLPEPAEDTVNEELVEVPQADIDGGRYVSTPAEQSSDPGRTLFEDLLTDDKKDHGDEPTLKQPDSTSTPMMSHQRVIAPPVRPGEPIKSDKPFDLQEAMQAAGTPQQLLPSAPLAPLAPTDSAPADSLANLEASVASPHVTTPGLEAARDGVNQAIISEQPLFPTPTQAMGAQPMSLEPPTVEHAQSEEGKTDQNAPPTVPPPMTPQFYDADGSNSNPFLNPNN